MSAGEPVQRSGRVPRATLSTSTDGDGPFFLCEPVQRSGLVPRATLNTSTDVDGPFLVNLYREVVGSLGKP